MLPVLLQCLLYASPVAYDVSAVPARYRGVYLLNPLAGLLEAFRWSLLGGGSPLYLPSLLSSVIVAGAFLWIGVNRFRAMEKSFADLI